MKYKYHRIETPFGTICKLEPVHSHHAAMSITIIVLLVTLGWIAHHIIF
jgi:hypothetical protein